MGDNRCDHSQYSYIGDIYRDRYEGDGFIYDIYITFSYSISDFFCIMALSDTYNSDYVTFAYLPSYGRLVFLGNI